jgi:hypothetical protein
VIRTLGLWLALGVSPTLGQAPESAPEAPIDRLEPNADGLAVWVQPFADGLVRADRWSALNVVVVNAGAATTGALQIQEAAHEDASSGVFQRHIELPQGARKEVQLAYRPGLAVGRPLELTTDGGRAASATFRVQALAEADVGIGVIGDDPAGVNAIVDAWAGPVPGRSVRPSAELRRVRHGLVPADGLPDRAAVYGALDLVVWLHPDPTEVGVAQMEALAGWVADGGHLFVSVTDNWRAVAGSTLGELLPVELSGVADAAGLDPLLDVLGVARAGPVPTPVATARRREVPGRRTWVRATLEDGRPVWVIGTFGLGTVHVLLAEPALAPLAGRPREEVWRRLLWLPPRSAPDSSWFEGRGAIPVSTLGNGAFEFLPLDQWSEEAVMDPLLADALHLGTSAASAAMRAGLSGAQSDWDAALRDRLADIPGVAPVPMAWLLLFSALYLLVIGPFDYFALRALKRQPYTWVTFPVYILLFSAIALVGTSWRKGNRAAVVRVALVDALPGTAWWRGDTYVGVFSTRKMNLELTSGFDDAVVAPLGPPNAMWDARVLSDQGPGRIAWRAETWTLAYARSSWVARAQGGVEVRVLPDGASWEVRNGLGVDLAAAALSYRQQAWDLGPVAAGEARTLRRDAGAPSPSDTYGDGSDVDLREATPEALLTWARSRHQNRPALDRGHLDAEWAHPIVLAVATASAEPLRLTGSSPETREVTVYRFPVPLAVFEPRESQP